MAAAALVRGGRTLYLVRAAGAVEPLGTFPPLSSGGALPATLLAPLQRAAREGPLRCDDPALTVRLAAAGVGVGEPDLRVLRAAREAIPRPSVRELRELLLELSHGAFATALSSPHEVLVALAREEERLERAAHRERAAQEELLSGASDPLRRFAASGAQLRKDLDRHLQVLQDELEAVAAEVAPNLRELLGASLTGRLVAAAGGLPRLATMSAARLQLLGTRRRPSPMRGPRYGVIFRAPRMNDVPLGRRAAYARSLAALAVIAARADQFTHRSVAPELVARRDRRIQSLRRRA